MTLLDLVIFLPLAAFLLILFLPKEHEEGIRRFSLVASLAIFVASLGLIGPYWFGNRIFSGSARRISVTMSPSTESASGSCC